MKTLYDRIESPRLAEELAERGCMDTEISEGLGIASATFYRWQLDHAEFREALRRGKRKPIREVEAALHRRAVGYEVVESEGIPDGAGGVRVTKVFRRHVEPNFTAQRFILVNRVPEDWKDVRQIEARIVDPYAGLSRMTVDERAKLIELLEKAEGSVEGHFEEIEAGPARLEDGNGGEHPADG